MDCERLRWVRRGHVFVEAGGFGGGRTKQSGAPPARIGCNDLLGVEGSADKDEASAPGWRGAALWAGPAQARSTGFIYFTYFSANPQNQSSPETNQPRVKPAITRDNSDPPLLQLRSLRERACRRCRSLRAHPRRRASAKRATAMEGPRESLPEQEGASLPAGGRDSAEAGGGQAEPPPLTCHSADDGCDA